MNDKNLHSDNNLNEDKLNNFFEKSEVTYSKSKEDIWDALNKNIDEELVLKRRFLNFNVILSVAASVIILFTAFAFLRFYTLSIESSQGQHLVYNLPDGSKVQLNAESVLKFHPYWWWAARELSFEGEGFFEVEKGSEFLVNSKKGKTIVLGTSFNIYSRNGSYNVSCFSGKVKVVSPKKEEVVLVSSYSAEIQNNGQIFVKKFSDEIKSSDWIRNMFSFTSVPLKEVLLEVERQFDIQIETEISNNLIYTGNFSVERKAEDILKLLCKPFGLEFEKLDEHKYRIY